MRDLNELNDFRDSSTRVTTMFGNAGDGTCGLFRIRSPIDSAVMTVIASSDDGWDHVSVSRVKRIPTWMEMSYVKTMFFRENETAMELHVPASQHISFHPNCLHLWRPNDGLEIPRPPSWMVA